MAGMSAGFGSVFGIPLAGAVFGLEVVALGAVTYRAVLPCLIASFAADFTTRALGEFPTAYIVPAHDLQAMFLGPRSLLFAALAGAVFGLAAALFALLTHRISGWCQRTVRYAPLRPLLGGAVLAALVFDTHAFRYIGLGVPTIVEAFAHPLPRYAFAAKILLTALTLGAGFKGGEVTPLFFIGATLGNALASLLPLPTGILAAMGFVAVFAGAAKTPLASSVMAFSLFGPEVGALAAVACLTSYMCSGRMGIYRAQPRSGPVRMIPRLRHAPETSVATRSRLPHP
jgi:H+/Cl- antiporter ClcA